jgi:hypothetical protein
MAGAGTSSGIAMSTRPVYAQDNGHGRRVSSSRSTERLVVPCPARPARCLAQTLPESGVSCSASGRHACGDLGEVPCPLSSGTRNPCCYRTHPGWIAVGGALVRWTPLPLPILLVVVGWWPRSCPASTPSTVDPELFLLLFIPPILFADAWVLPRRDFVRVLKPVLLLALGLVVLTVVAVGYVMHWLIPAMPLAVAFTLGAIVSPTDAVATVATTECCPCRRASYTSSMPKACSTMPRDWWPSSSPSRRRRPGCSRRPRSPATS